MFWNLSVWSGLFPSRLWTFAPKVCLFFGLVKWPLSLVFGVSMNLVSLWATRIQRVLYPLWHFQKTLYLNRFRRKPAISEFDWLFTPYHKSSPPIATDVGSVLQKVLPHFQPARDKITRFRVQILELIYVFTTPPPHGLSLLQNLTRWPIMQKVRCHSLINRKLQLFVGFGFQFYFTPFLGFFSPFPHGTCSLSVRTEYLGLEGGPPIFHQEMFSMYSFQTLK